jgi:hypothetical protein
MLKDLLGVSKIGFASFGQRKLTAGAVNQPGAQLFLQRRHLSGHRRGRSSQLARSRRQAAVLHNPHEHLYGFEGIHGMAPAKTLEKYSFCETIRRQ